MPNETLTGARYPATTAAPNVAQDIQNAVADLADNTIPRFSSTAARNSAYSAWVAAGNTMVDYLMCAVTGIGPMYYLSGVWTPIRQNSPITAATNSTLVRTTEVDTWALVLVADPGYAYRIRTSAVCRTFATDCTLTLRVRVGSSSLTAGSEPIVTEISNTNNNTGLDIAIPARLSGVITGGARIVGHCLRTQGTGGWQVNPAPSLVYEVVPV